jgi:hypothetical protein
MKSNAFQKPLDDTKFNETKNTHGFGGVHISHSVHVCVHDADKRDTVYLVYRQLYRMYLHSFRRDSHFLRRANVNNRSSNTINATAHQDQTRHLPLVRLCMGECHANSRIVVMCEHRVCDAPRIPACNRTTCSSKDSRDSLTDCTTRATT